MPRDRFDECVRRRQPKTLSDEVRAELIIKLRRLGWTYKAIGRRVGLSPNGVKYALMRVTQPGRYYGGPADGEVDAVAALEEW
jgi:hypothetical protein